jgi:hypothetical protein
MPENEWTMLALACLELMAAGIHDPARRLRQAWLEGTLHLRGVPLRIPETREYVEIPSSEAALFWLDCPGSRVLRGSRRRHVWEYKGVQAKTADVERLKQEARGGHTSVVSPALQAPQSAERLAQGQEPREAAAPAALPSPEQVPQGAERATTTTVAEDGPEVIAAAAALLRLYPEAPPAGVRREALLTEVRKAGGKVLAVVSITTLDRARKRLGWTRKKTR